MSIECCRTLNAVIPCFLVRGFLSLTVVYTANLAFSDAVKYGLDLLGTARTETLPCLDAAQLTTTLTLLQGVRARIF